MKVLYVSTISNTINAFMIPHIELLLNQGHHVDIACNIDREISSYLVERGCTVFNIEFQRSPLAKDNYIAYKKLKKLIKTGQYDIVHTHTPIASACVRLACRKIENVKVIYTAHGFHFFKGAPLKNWLIYYPIEYWLAKYTDVLITINNEDCKRAKISFKAKSVNYIPSVGLDTKKFSQGMVNRLEKRREIGIEEKAFVVLSIGELNKNKNHETVIKAIARLNNPHINYVICGKGPLENHLKYLVKQLGIEKQVKFLGFRKDVADICKISDVFCFPSRREGLGMAALEAMASGLPIITSNVHGIVDYSVNGITGYTCSPTDVKGFANNINKLLIHPEDRKTMAKHNIDAVKKFDTEGVKTRLLEIYLMVYTDFQK